MTTAFKIIDNILLGRVKITQLGEYVGTYLKNSCDVFILMFYVVVNYNTF